MIDDEEVAKILRLYRTEKWTVGTIAKQIGRHYSTVKLVLTQAGEDTTEATRVRMVDPYVPFLEQTLAKYPDLHASRLYQMIKERGYPGALDHFRSLVALYRPRPAAEAFLRLRTLPGEQAQVDWGHFGQVKIGQAARALSAFVMVLSYSRSVYLNFFYGQNQSLFLLGHQQAFASFGGVARVLLYDNLKSVVLERQGDALRFHPALLSFAAHYGYEPRPVAVARGNEKGRVERAIQYIRHAFFAGREFTDLEDLNGQALVFCQGLAAQRKVPDDKTLTVGQALERERPRLLSLPPVPYPVQERLEVSVGKTPYARFDKNDYSVPHDRVQRTLVVQATPQQVRILEGTLVVATHVRTYDQGQTVEDPTHIEALVQRKQAAHAHRGLNRLTLAVPQCQELLVRLAQRGGNLGSATAALMRLLDHHGPTELQAAVADALQHDASHPNAVRLILDRRLLQRKQPPPLAVALPKDPRLQNLSVVPHALATYDTLAPEEDDADPSKR
jgi:transposase